MRRSSPAKRNQKVAKAAAAAGMGAAAKEALGFLDGCPDAALDLIDLIVEEGRRKKPRERLLDTYLLMLAHALEFIRYRIERDLAQGHGQAEAVRQRILAYGRAGELEPAMLLAILSQFGNAKLDTGGELQGFMAELLHARFGAEAEMLDEHALSRQWAHFAEVANGDVFALYDHLTEQAGAFPPEHRSAMAAAMIQADEAIVREATVGLLLDGKSSVRTLVTAALAEGITAGLVTGIMLRRMIAMRNWLPEAERPGLDGVIRAARKRGLECAAWPAPQVQKVIASPFDGSGAQSLFVVVHEGRKFAVAALLLKQAIGVRDAWVRRGLSRRELRAFLAQVAAQLDLWAVTLDHVRVVTKHFLGVGAMNGAMPPFGLVDVAEAIGMSDLNPADRQIEDIVDELFAEVGSVNRTAEAADRLIEDSGRWPEDHPFTQTWFEHDGEVDALLGGKRSAWKQQAALVLDKLLPRRRRKWAELIGWTALTLKADDASQAWEAFAVAARDLLTDRPLTDFPVMRDIADRTVAAFADHSARG